MADDGHACPGPGCLAAVPSGMLACRAHWRQVPLPVRQAVIAAWRNGQGSGTVAHLAAMDAAVSRMRPLARMSCP